jgi:hypothetical protein
MEDVTSLMNTYRECSRHLWNVYFSSREIGCSRDCVFDDIRKLLFESLVLCELPDQECSGDRTAEDPATSETDLPPVLKVVPGTVWSPILIHQKKTSLTENTYWNQEKVDLSDVELIFDDYFDFDELSVRDFNYYRCKILRFPSHFEFEGRDALMEVQYAKVFLGEKNGGAQ